MLPKVVGRMRLVSNAEDKHDKNQQNEQDRRRHGNLLYQATVRRAHISILAAVG
jgi:hypothetical protein